MILSGKNRSRRKSDVTTAISCKIDWFYYNSIMSMQKAPSFKNLEKKREKIVVDCEIDLAHVYLSVHIALAYLLILMSANVFKFLVYII